MFFVWLQNKEIQKMSCTKARTSSFGFFCGNIIEFQEAKEFDRLGGNSFFSFSNNQKKKKKLENKKNRKIEN